MTDPQHLPAPASRHALSLLRFPDPRTDWVVVTVATLTQPVDAATLSERLTALHQAVPVVGARLRDETWFPDAPPTIEVVDGDPLGSPGFDHAFDLARDAPLRLLLGSEGRRLAVIGHHAAFDGLALVAVITALADGDLPQPVTSPPPGAPGSKLPLLRRLVRPAQAVAATPGIWPGDAYATATVQLSGRGITGRITEACVDAVRVHNQAQGQALDRVGVTVAIGGPAGVGNVASYRRLDLRRSDAVADAVQAALQDPSEPGEQVSAPKLLMKALTPVVERFSDTILVSNLGRQTVPGVERIDFFPVARGRSAVCFASASVAGGETTMSIRARDLSPGDAQRVLADAVARLTAVT